MPHRHDRTSPGRRALAATLLAAAGVVAFQACADDPRPTEAPAATDVQPTAGEHATAKAGADAPSAAAEFAWVGQAHHDGLRAVFRTLQADGLRPHPAPDDAARHCTALAGATAQFTDVLARGAYGYVPDAVRARLQATPWKAGAAACAVPVPEPVASLADALRRALRDGRAYAGPEAHALIGQIDHQINVQPSAAAFDAALGPIEHAAARIADPSDRTLVLSSASTARASAYDAEAHCTETDCVPYGPPPDPLAPTRTHDGRAFFFGSRGRGVVRADVAGCIDGAARSAGWPHEMLIGCIGGAVWASGRVIWQPQ